jgi:hypothetical protein
MKAFDIHGRNTLKEAQPLSWQYVQLVHGSGIQVIKGK